MKYGQKIMALFLLVLVVDVQAGSKKYKHSSKKSPKKSVKKQAHQVSGILKKNSSYVLRVEKNVSFSSKIQVIRSYQFETEIDNPTQWHDKSNRSKNKKDFILESGKTFAQRCAELSNKIEHRSKILKEQKIDPLAFDNFELKKENQQLKEQNELLNKKMIFFAGLSCVTTGYVLFNYINSFDESL